MTVDPGDWPTPDGDSNGEVPPVPWPGEPAPSGWFHPLGWFGGRMYSRWLVYFTAL